jgi:hypothetical protein
MIKDWKELVKHNRNRNLTSMLNNDLVLSKKLEESKHTYLIILEKQLSELVRVENKYNKDNEIVVSRPKISLKEEALAIKDTQVTIDCEINNAKDVKLRS